MIGAVLATLHELIAAIDRRRPQPLRRGEAGIVRDAATLRADAVDRITELEGERRRER